MASPSPLFLLQILLFAILPSPISPSSINDTPSTYIVSVHPDAVKPSIFPTHSHWYQSSLSSLLSPSPPLLIHTYTGAAFHGFSVKLSPTQALLLRAQPHVLSLLPDRLRRLHTTRSPHFLGLGTSTDSAGLLKDSDFGSDLVVAVLDTGISPDRQSFHDRDLPPVPTKWKGSCVNTPDFPSSSCNRKLVGAKFFCAVRSPRDSDGHGTHTASIAAGRYVYPASTLGYARGLAAGMAPKARLAVYKVCWTAGCYDSDILAAFDAAVADGVDVISLSVGGDKVSPSGIPSDHRTTEFNILSGTSMACPHVSGLAALLKAAHPEWSPAAIKSAFMTTAYTVDNRGKTMLDESTDFGSGHVHPQKAMDPGLVYDLTTFDYVDFLCNSNYTEQNIKVVTRKNADCSGARRAGHSGNLNYPSMAVVFQQYGIKQKMSTHFIRTVTNVGDGESVYSARVVAPAGMVATVKPEKLVFRRAGQKLNFLVRVQTRVAKLAPGGSVMKSGFIVWSDGKHNVTSPIVVTLQQPL
ncbi:unnamed protein product [Linum tenue]|uniref:Subtilisin-like protease SBT1.5 n=1 Tax=Linum tenue TaxID=586396 RepID=A0AAV0KER7_9ROSI|nr:unnamed protein product [Linum tenue]